MLAACNSSDSEVQKKYEGCKMLQSMMAQSQQSSMIKIKSQVDCDAGKQACDNDKKSAACITFLNAVKIR
jgi:hypothetical protein